MLFRRRFVLLFKRTGAYVSGKKTTQKAVTLPPRITMSHIVHLQVTLLVMNPPIMGPKSGAPNIEPTATVILMPRPRACQLSLAAPPTIVAGDAPQAPARKRPIRMTGTLCPRAGIRLNSAPPPLPVSKGILRPNFSESGPQNGGPKQKPYTVLVITFCQPGRREDWQ